MLPVWFCVFIAHVTYMPDMYWGVTIHKTHDSVCTSVLRSRFGMIFGTAVFLI